MSQLITKTAYSKYYKCPAVLWAYRNEPSVKSSVALEYRGYIGTVLGQLAQKVFDNSIEINQIDVQKNVLETRELLNSNKTLFEAGFVYGDLYARTDVLIPANDSYDIIEVKQGTNISEDYIRDIAFQKYVLEKSGLKIQNASIMTVNNKYLKNGNINPKDLFEITDVTNQLDNHYNQIEGDLINIRKILSSISPPEFDVNTCKDREDCVIHKQYFEQNPEIDIFSLRKANQKAIELYNQGIKSISQIPNDYELSANQRIQYNCVKSGKAHIDKIKIKDFLSGLKYPLFFLDFEAGGSPIPLFDNTKAYQKIPFQYSVHKIESPNSDPEHFSYLSLDKVDPRKEILESLIKDLGTQGSIVVYYAPMERNVVKDLCSLYPIYADFLNNFNSRIIDLHEVFDKFYYYNPMQKGSTSIKKVLPVFSDISYKDMDINNGDDASCIYNYIIQSNKYTKEEISNIKHDLEEYCGLDTMSMIIILNKLNDLVI